MRMNKTLPLTICTLFKQPCRHCSEEHKLEIVREGTIANMNFKKHEKVVALGQYCNDAGMWVADMHYCPVVWGNHRLAHLSAKKELKTVMKDKKVEKKWKGRKDSDTRRTLEILRIGQQKLRI